MFHDIKAAIDWIESQHKFREKASLDILKKAFNMLSISIDDIKKIHIAGTNGKGSTASYVSHILMEQQAKVGTFTSPYLVNFNERIRINFVPIEDDALLKLINELYLFNETLFEKEQVKLSFFEILTLGALLYFRQENVDYIVMEVGIGGLLDATNIIEYDVSLITNIGFDHMKQLGNTKEEIALNKLGILKSKGMMFTTVDASLKNLFKRYADRLKANIHFVKERDIFAISTHKFSYQGIIYETPLLGDYQRLNAALAIEAINYLVPTIETQAIYNGLKKSNWPGRLEEILPNVYIDAAHNIDAMIALKRNIHYLFHKKKVTILFSALGDKDILGMLEVLKETKATITLTSFEDIRYQDLSIYQDHEKIIFQDQALDTFRELYKNKSEEEILIITGSIHFIGFIKKNIK